MAVHLFGIRHHGPGCARSLVKALHELQPDCILIEGPPEADTLLPLVSAEGMQTPVAILVYAPAMPQHAVYYPFAEFSPEWQAILYGQQHNVETRFMDLPQAYRLAEEMSLAAEPVFDTETETEALDSTLPQPNASTDESIKTIPLRADPLLWLAQAAGFSDTETWWDHLVEQRQDSLDLFAAIEEIMGVARNELSAESESSEKLSLREAQREAYMRQTIRQAMKQGHQRIAVVCGAWHVPALRNMPSAKSDTDILKNLNKAKVAATWTPWTYGRLCAASGYGAGVQAPGWYHHCWNTPQKAAMYWLTDAMRLLRKNDLDASSAHLIEVLRLADSLASLRDRSRPGLDELLESLQSVLFGNSQAPMQLIQNQLLINDRLGSIPTETPTLPLVADVRALQKRLRLAPKIEQVDLELDLRQAAHLEKSCFLHRLNLLGIHWGKTFRVSGKSGSFHEHWRLTWQAEFELGLIEANVWGATLESACDAKLRHQAQHCKQLPQLSKLVEDMLLADIKSAVPTLMQAMQKLSASTNDAGILLEALPALANILRYGNTRGTDLNMVSEVFAGLVQRACIALPIAAHGINSDAAQTLLRQINLADQALQLLQQEEYKNAWLAALQLASSPHNHALIAGRAVRLLIDHEAWNLEQCARALSLACSNPINPLASAEWLEGFLQGSGLLLIMNDQLWQILQDWVASLPEEIFTELLPLLRRSFCHFEAAERRQLGQKVATGTVQLHNKQDHQIAIHEQRAAVVLPMLSKILSPANELQTAQHAEKNANLTPAQDKSLADTL